MTDIVFHVLYTFTDNFTLYLTFFHIIISHTQHYHIQSQLKMKEGGRGGGQTVFSNIIWHKMGQIRSAKRHQHADTNQLILTHNKITTEH